MLGPRFVRRAVRLVSVLLAAGLLLFALGQIGPLYGSARAPGNTPARATQAPQGSKTPGPASPSTHPQASGPIHADLLKPLETVPTTKKLIALTFDISWGKIMPPKVVAILERDRVPATFFLSGPWIRYNADFVKSMAKVPYFELETHGQAHVNFSGLGSRGVITNIQKAADELYAVTGRRPTMVRPPNGDYNRESLAATASLGLRTVIWGTDSLDWMNPGVSVIISRVVRRAHPGDIVLLHASDTCKQTDIALPTILKDLHQRGYTFVTIGQLLHDERPSRASAQTG